MPAPTPLRAARDLSRASHPGPTAAVTGVMTALAFTAGHGAAGTLQVALAVLAGQLSVGWSNDYLDRYRDRRAARATKPVAAGTLPAPHVAIAAMAALTAAAALSFASGWRAALAHLGGIAAAWAYNLGLKRTAASPLPYAAAFGLLPAFVTLGLDGHPWPAWWTSAAGALLGTAAHFTNVLPDMVDDTAAGVRGLPHRIGAGTSRLVSVVALVAASALLVAVPSWHAGDSGLGAATSRSGVAGPGGVLGVAAIAGGAAAIAAGIGVVAGRRRSPGTRELFAVTVAVAVADIALLLARGTSIY